MIELEYQLAAITWKNIFNLGLAITLQVCNYAVITTVKQITGFKMCKIIDELLATGFKLVDGLYKRVKLIPAKDYAPNTNYKAIHNWQAYTLTQGDWVHYLAELEIVDPCELEDAESISDVLYSEDLDGNGFWIKSDNPKAELKQRLLDFECILSKVFETHKNSFWGTPNLDCIPTDNEHCCIAWANYYLGGVVISNDFITAKNQVESLMYKYRKMVELYDSHRYIINLL